MKKYDLLTEIENVRSIKTQNGKVTSVKNSSFEKKGLRKFENGQAFYFSYFGEIATSHLLEKSMIVPGTGIPVKYVPNEIESRTFACESSLKLGLDGLESKLEQIERAVSEYTDRFSFSGTYRLINKTTSLRNDSDKLLQASHVEMVHWYLIKRSGSASIMDAFFWNCTLEMTSEYTLECLTKTLDGYDRKATIKAGEYPILFAQRDDAEGILFEKIKSSLMADQYYENSGILSGKLGSQYFDERLTVMDTNVDSSNGVFAPFDGEGFVRSQRALPLIENGIIRNVIADQRLAQKYKIEPTGNGLRNFKSAPRAAYNSVKVLPGQKSTENILKSIPQCIVIMMGGGGDFTDVGDYSLPVEFSYLFEYGELIGRLAPITVRSTVQKMFGNGLIEIASDNYFKSDASPSMFIKMDVLIN